MSLQVDEEPFGSELSISLVQAYFDELQARFPSGFAELDARQAGKQFVPPEGRFVIARVDGQPAGCGALRLLGHHTAEVKHVWVQPAYRGQKIARAIMHALERAARTMSCSRVVLDTSEYLPEAIGLYRSAGYVEIPPYNDNPYAHYWFEKTLAP